MQRYTVLADENMVVYEFMWQELVILTPEDYVRMNLLTDERKVRAEEISVVKRCVVDRVWKM
jgi:hypothetical protein